MVNYSNGKIYKIEPIIDHDEGDIYIGSTTKKYLINCKLYVTNIELYGEIGNDGIIHLIKESWVYTGFDDNIVVSLSLDLI